MARKLQAGLVWFGLVWFGLVWFVLARLLYAIPNGQIGKAAGDVFQMELGHCVRQENYKKSENLFYKFSIRLTLVGIISTNFSNFFSTAFDAPYIRH
jgi:hypothetical protein